MRAIVIWTGLLCGTFLLAARADEEPLRWLHSIDEARRIAAAEHKDVLVNFTGLEWCGHCMDLDRGVLTRREFRAAADGFVLVDLDFPGDHDKLGERRAPYETWSKQYLIHGFPTVVLMDDAGRPYQYFTGYESDDTVAKFMEQLAGARRTHQARDRDLAAANEATGAVRAQKLHAAIETVAKGLGSLDDREDDPVLTFYGDEAAEIRRLDADNAMALRAVYDARVTVRDSVRRRMAVLEEINKLSKDMPAALTYIDEQLKTATDTRLRYHLEQRRYFLLDASKEYPQAMVALQRLLDDPACPADDRDWMLRNQAILLFHMQRLDEALAFYDRQIKASAGNDARRAYFLGWKWNMLLGTGRHDEIVATCREKIAAEKPHSSGWSEARSNLAWSLQIARRHEQAIAQYQELLTDARETGEPEAGPLLSIARSQHALGQFELEGQTLDAAEKTLATLADRPTKQKELDDVHETLKKARAALAEKSPK